MTFPPLPTRFPSMPLLDELLRQAEGKTLEFKRDLSSPGKVHSHSRCIRERRRGHNYHWRGRRHTACGWSDRCPKARRTIGEHDLGSDRAKAHARASRDSLAKAKRGRHPCIPQLATSPLRSLELYRGVRQHRHDYLRIPGVTVTATSMPSGLSRRVTICPHGSFCAFVSNEYPLFISSVPACSMSSTSNSSHA